MREFSNNGAALLAVGIDDSQSTLSVGAGMGDLFPAVTAPNFFMITVEDGTGKFEIMRCVTRNPGSDTLQVLRAEEDTTPYSFVPNSRVELRTTKGTMDSFIQRDGDTVDGGTF